MGNFVIVMHGVASDCDQMNSVYENICLGDVSEVCGPYGSIHEAERRLMDLGWVRREDQGTPQSELDGDHFQVTDKLVGHFVKNEEATLQHPTKVAVVRPLGEL